MKTIKFLAILCAVFVFSTDNATSQKVIGEQTTQWYFTPDQIPCLTEVVSGDIVEIQSYTNRTYHVKPRGVLYGESSGDEYYISYEYNQYVDWSEGYVFHAVFPIILRHNGKLVAEIQGNWRYVFTADWILVVGRDLYIVNCREDQN